MPDPRNDGSTNIHDPLLGSDEELRELFTYHAPTGSQVGAYEAINKAAYSFAVILKRHCPAGADRLDALRLIRMARMTANASVALKGKG